MTVWAHAALFPARPSEVVNAGVDVLSHAAYLSWETVDSLPSYRNRVKAAPFRSAKPSDPAIDRLLRLMAERGAILDATLWLFHAQVRSTTPSPNEDFQVDKSILEAAEKFAYAVTRRARELGVLVSAGTDGQGALTEGSLPNLHNELELLVNESGFSPLEAIRSATSIAARTMRLESTGTIAEGKQADLVVLRSDPTKAIGNTRDIALVVKRGREVK
jgi:imidazolonepropionase-like amidohydrolase